MGATANRVEPRHDRYMARRNDRIDAENFEIEVIDADTFLGGY